jgi:membrane fusion protein (multidrug efflux system)
MSEAASPAAPAPSAAADHPHHLPRRLAIAGAALVVVVLAVVGWRTLVEHPGWVATDDADIESDITPISARVAGYVREVPVGDFQAVKAGQVLARLEDSDYRAQADRAAADVAAAEAQLANLAAQKRLLTANIAAAQAAVAATDATLERNRQESTRQHRLDQDGVGSRQLLEQADANLRQGDAQMAQNRAQVEAAASQLGILAAQEKQAQAALAGQTAALNLARINLGYTVLAAPSDGAVGQRLARPGQYLNVGGQVFSLAADRLWVIANFKETQLTHVVVGEPAEITVDAYPGKTLKGHVIAFSPAAGAKFALLPPDNATGNFTKIAQRVAVKIALDDVAGLGGRLRAGLSVTARIDTRRERDFERTAAR